MIGVRFQRNFSILTLIVMLSISSAFAQNTTGEIDGMVTDSSGAAVPAQVIITRADTNEVVRQTQTNSKGEFSAPLLSVGAYSLAATAPGFQRTDIVKIELNVGDTLTITPRLKPGNVDTTVTVTTTQVAPDMETATQGTVINETEMKELALNTRNFEQMVILQPGVSYTGDDQNYAGSVDASGSINLARISINGLRNTQLSWSLDGADILNEENSAQVAIFPSVDSISQIKTLRNSYGAQYGGGGSAEIIAVTKAGGSQIHGNAYYFFRNQYLNANNFFNLIANPIIPRPPVRQNTFGYTLDGPLFIPKLYPRAHSHTFFFFSQEMRRIALYPTSRIGTLPTPENLKGYIELIPNADPTKAGACPATYTKNDGTSPYPNFPCHFLTTIDPAAQAYINDVMLPTVTAHPPNDPANIHGLIEQDRSTNSQTQESVRIDHQFTSRLTAFVRYIFDPSQQVVPAGIGRSVGYPGVGNSTIYSYGEDLLLHATFVATPTTVMEFGYSYLPYTIKARPFGTALLSNSPDVAAAFHLPYANTTGRIPNITINQGTAWGTNGPRGILNHTQQAFINVTRQIGRHTVYVGANYEHFYATINAGTNNAGAYAFNGNFQNSFARFLFGTADTFTQASVDPFAKIDQNLSEAYLQDNWRATTHLTLNAGVRYSIYAQPYDRDNHLGGLSPTTFNSVQTPTFGTDGSMCITGVVNAACNGTAPNPNYNANNGIINGGTNSPFGRALSRNSYLDFAPRVGFAWDVYGNGKTSLRGGFGIFYNHAPLTLAEGAVNGNPNYVQNLSGAAVSLDSPSVSAQTQVLAISGQDPNWITPYTESYSLDVQQTLGTNWMLDLSYVGNKTLHLQGEEDLNQPLPGTYAALGINGGKHFVNSVQTQLLNPIRPYPGWGPIDFYGTRYFADYNGMQVQMTKRFSKRSLVSANYTWSKAMANSTGETGSSPSNRYDLNAEWGPTSTDRRHIFVVHTVYDLPFFRKQKGILGHSLGGWEISAIVQMRTGLNFTATGTNQDPAGQGVLAVGSDAPDRPDQIGDPNTGKRTSGANSFFNTAAFLQALPANVYRPGNARVGSIKGPNYQNVTADLFKNMQLTEKVRFQLRLEAFNALNHVNFNAVGNGINNSGNFGTVTTAFDNRQLQLGAKLYF